VASPAKTFRIFVSSTFSDLKAERNALEERVFPRLQELCLAHGARFQAIDLRWGVSEEASLDQQTMRICLGEIARCQQVTPRPNFIVLLGDRYGWRPLPEEIPASEFEEIEKLIADEDARALLGDWYRRDDNGVPPVYVLQPREGEYEHYALWEAKVERPLRAALIEATAGMDLPHQSRLKYEASATHQEIVAGALGVEDSPEHVFCFFRNVDSLPADETAKDFLDLDPEGRPDQEARRRQEKLKDQLRKRLPGHVYEYQAGWTDGGVTTDHLDQLCADVYDSLSKVMLDEIGKLEAIEPLEAEIAAHQAFGLDRASHFVGRGEILESISRYLEGESNHPLAIWGESGTGKSALMAKAVEQAQEAHPEAVVICRFIGATPDSSSGRALLEGMCRQISRRHGGDESTVPLDYRGLVQDFGARIAIASPERQLFLFIDALDQLSAQDLARSLDWLPAALPANARIVVSLLPGDCLGVLEARLPSEGLIRLESMRTEYARDLLDSWLADAGRTLQTHQRAAILEGFDREDNRLPLYLRLAFEEGRRWRSYADPGDTQLGPDVHIVVAGLFARLADEANHGEMLVSRALGYLAAARSGLAEEELIELLSRDVDLYASFLEDLYHVPPDLVSCAREHLGDAAVPGGDGKKGNPVGPVKPEEWLADLRRDEVKLKEYLSEVLPTAGGPRLPVVLWSRLHFDLEPYLISRGTAGSALLEFYHRQLGEVAARTYLREEKGVQIHGRLAAYFRSKADPGGDGTWTGTYPRGLSETPYHQYHGGLTDELVDTVADLRFVDATSSAFSPQTMLDQLELGLAAARESSSEANAIAVLAGWGYAVGKACVEDRARSLLRQGRVADALRVARHTQPATRGARLLTALAHQALDDGQLLHARQILEAILACGLPVAPGDLRPYLRMIDRFVQQGTWEALACLRAERPAASAAYVLLYVIGTTQWSDKLAHQLALQSQSLNNPYWEGICLLYIACRAARLGLSAAQDVAGRLATIVSQMADGQDRLALQEAAARCARWLAVAGLSMEQLGLEQGAGPTVEAGPPQPSGQLELPQGGQAGDFDFLQVGEAVTVESDGRDLATALRSGLGALVDAAGRDSLWQNDELAGAVRHHAALSLEGTGPDSADALYWASLIGEQSPRSSDLLALQRSYDLPAMEGEERALLLASLARLGEHERLRVSLEQWRDTVAASHEEAEVYRTVRELSQWKSANEFLTAASDQLRASIQSPGVTPAVTIELLRSLVEGGRRNEATYWIGHLLNVVAPKMSFDVAPPAAASPSRRDAYALLARALPAAPADDDPAGMRQTAMEYAQRLDKEHPGLSAAMRKEHRSQASPLPYLADRIIAFWAEADGWREPDQAVTLSRFVRLLRLGVVNDDRERLRSWFFWLLVLGGAPDRAQVEDWQEGVAGAFAPPEPYQKAVRRALEASGEDELSRLDILRAVVALLGEQFGPPAIVGELYDAVMRGFGDPIEQAEGLSALAEACVRLGQDAEAAAFAATAEALAPGFGRQAKVRMHVARAAREAGVDSLREWPEAGTFREVYRAILERLARRGKAESLLGLTAFISSAPSLWHHLLLALCGSLRERGKAATAGGALLRAIERVDERHEQGGRVN
jgi:hypothetical protein